MVCGHMRNAVNNILAFGALIAFAVMLFSAKAQAQAIVLGENDAYRCYMKVKTSPNSRASTVKLCEKALEDLLSSKDRASTLVNLGIAQMRLERYEDANISYGKATDIRPQLSEAYINRAASLIYQQRCVEAMDDLKKATELGTDKMPEVLFNRSMCYHSQEKYALAYNDLKAALELRPDWQPAVNAISRYVVKKKA